MINVTGTYENNLLGEFFTTHVYEYMIPILIILVFLFIINIKTIKKQFSKIDKKTWTILIIIFFFGFWLRNSSYTYGANVDGYFYQEAAKTIYEKGLFLKGCAIGSLEDCRLYHQVLWPAGYPILITIFFHIFGEYDIIAMIISGVLGSITTILIFLISYLLFSSKKIGLYSSAIFAFIPLDIYLSSTATVRTTSLFFISLTILTFLIALKENDIKIWSLFAILLSYTLYVRQDNLVILIPLVFLFLTENYRKLKSGEKLMKNIKKSIIPISILLVTSIPFFHWFLLSKIHFGVGFSALSFIYVSKNLPYMIKNFFLPEFFMEKYFFIPWVSIIFLISMPLLILLLEDKKDIINNVFLWLFFILFFLGTAMFFDPVANSIRRMQILFLPYSIITGFTISFILEKMIKTKRNIILILITALVFSGFIFGISYNPYIFRDNRMEENFTNSLIKAMRETPKNSLIFTSQTTVPNFDLVERGRRFIDIDLISFGGQEYVYNEIKKSKIENRNIYLIEDYRCGFGDLSEIKDGGQCEFIYKNFNFTDSETLEDTNIYDRNIKICELNYLGNLSEVS